MRRSMSRPAGASKLRRRSELIRRNDRMQRLDVRPRTLRPGPNTMWLNQKPAEIEKTIVESAIDEPFLVDWKFGSR